MTFQSVIGPTWLGFSGIRRFMIFGDSYSSVGWIAGQSLSPRAEDPLGVAFPGSTYTEHDTPNWVGHLVTNYSNHGPLLVYDYAVGGDTVAGVSQQVREMFLPRVGSHPFWAPWGPSDTLFITWVGINDCAWADETTIELSIKRLFADQELLYESGARNFLFVDIPPIHRTPAGRAVHHLWPKDKPTSYSMWNAHLPEAIMRFVKAHPDITTLLYSSWNTFNRVLDDPETHGLSEDEIWVDHLHPTSAMHDWIAHDIAAFLTEQRPYQELEK
ncbi:SGNH hydrolase-type esterase domain-containing protein [Amylocystis lapponica]|nr:SGNH hydrolase-type esterase domain-containing protein [Amylocystis lapponica]